MRYRSIAAGTLGLTAVIALAGCASEKTDGSASFAGSDKTHESPSRPAPSASAPSSSATSSPTGSDIDLVQWSRPDTCAVLRMSGPKVPISIASPFPQSKGGGCIFGGKDVTYGVQLMKGGLDEVPIKNPTAGPVRFTYQGRDAVKYCDRGTGKLGCYVVVQVSPQHLYFLTHNKIKGTADQNRLLSEVVSFNGAVYSGLKAGAMLQPDPKEHFPTQAQYDGKRKPGLHPTTDVCNGKLLKFNDLPYNGMSNSSTSGPTRFRNGTETVGYDIMCSWDVHDFVKGYTPPPASKPEKRDPSISMSDSLSKLSDSLKNLADIYRHERIIIVSLGFRNHSNLSKPAATETTYSQNGRTIFIYKQADKGGFCRSRFPYGKGNAVLVVGDSTGGRYGSSCTAVRTLTRKVLDREPS